MKLHTKFLLGINAVLVVTFAAAFYVTYSREREASMEKLRDSAELIGEASADSTQRIMDNTANERARLQTWCEELTALESIRWVAIYDQRAEIIAQSSPEGQEPAPSARYADQVERVLAGREPYDNDNDDGSEPGANNGYLRYFVPIHGDGADPRAVTGVVGLLTDPATSTTRSEAEIVAKMASITAPGRYGRDQLQALTEGLARLQNVMWVEIFDADATVLAHTQSERVGGKPLPIHERYVSEIFRTLHSIQEFDRAGERLNYFLPVRRYDAGDGSVSAVIEVVMSTRSLEEHAMSAASQLFIILGLLMLALSLAFGLLARRFIIRPVNMLSAAAKRIAAGELDHRIEIRTSDEFKQLADTFNTMMEAVEEYNQTKEYNQAKADFLANISHEIRTPMNGILGMAQILKTTPLSDDQLDYVQTMLISGDNLMVIINDILDFSKITAQKMQLDESPFDLRIAAEQAVDLFAGKALQKELELILDFQAERQRFVVGDAGKIRQLLTNLIGNAIKFTSSGFILVTVSHEKHDDGHQFLFEVADTGIGLPEDMDTDKLFDDFTQADMSSTRQYGGTGLGLAICKKLVVQMSGEIGADNREQGGARFWFKLPLPLAEEANPIPYPISSVAKTRVLVADGNLPACMALHRLFECWGMRSEYIESGEQALTRLRDAAAQGEPFDVILVGHTLSDMDALEFSERATAMDEVSAHVVLMVQSSYGLETHGKALEEVFTATLNKPIHQSELLNLLTQLWSMRSAGAPMAEKSHRNASERTRSFDLDILVVEDDPSSQRVAKQLLEDLGCRAMVVASGHECLKLLEDIDVDGIFMDLQMPVMNGFDTTRAIRALEDTRKRDVPIVALTAHAMGTDRERALAEGMDGYVTKPVKSTDLVFAIETWFVPARQRKGA